MSAKEPNCRHAKTVRVSSHDYDGMIQAARDRAPLASIYSCERARCLGEAKFWVQGVSGRPAQVEQLPTRQPAG